MGIMVNWIRCFVFPVAILLAFSISCLQASLEAGNEVKSATFLSPKLVLGPGSVENRFYYDIDFPRGHIGLKSLNAEVIDEAGKSIPLHETYLHHWVITKYYRRRNMEITDDNGVDTFDHSNYIFAKNGGVCPGYPLRQYFGLGSETRKTETNIPDPYAIEVGNPDEIPEGFEEKWMVNVHAIDTRGVEDRLGCTECRCNLYNVTVDGHGQPLRPDYKGGLYCCRDNSQCKVRKGFEAVRRSLYLRYTVKWVDWDSSFIPVQVYVLDVTDNRNRLNSPAGFTSKAGCQIEYEIEPCNKSDGDNICIDNKRTSITFPKSGYVIYGVAHQHTGGIGSTLYGKDGRVICTSLPIYGKGQEAGNEEGYIVGMSTCYPEPGSVKIEEGEDLILESNYSSSQHHTGVMGILYLLVADQTSMPTQFLPNGRGNSVSSNQVLAAVVLISLAIVIVVGAAAHRRFKSMSWQDYQTLN